MIIFSNKQQENVISNSEDNIVLKPRESSEIESAADKYINTQNALRERIENINMDEGDIDDNIRKINKIAKESLEANYELTDKTINAIRKDNPDLARKLRESLEKLQEIKTRNSAN